MEKIVKDGWYKVYDYKLCEYEVYVEFGIVKRCLCNDCTAYPYRVYKNGGWYKDLDISFDDLRAGLLTGNVVITC